MEGGMKKNCYTKDCCTNGFLECKVNERTINKEVKNSRNEFPEKSL